MFLFYNIAPFKFFYGESHFHFLTVFENFHPLFLSFWFSYSIDLFVIRTCISQKYLSQCEIITYQLRMSCFQSCVRKNLLVRGKPTYNFNENTTPLQVFFDSYSIYTDERLLLILKEYRFQSEKRTILIISAEYFRSRKFREF